PGICTVERQHRRNRGTGRSPAGGVAQSEIHGLVGLIERVFDDGDSESLAGYSRAESERTGRGGVVGTRSGRSITGGIIDCYSTGCTIRADHRNDNVDPNLPYSD